MAQANGLERRPTTGATSTEDRTYRRILVRNADSLDGFFSADLPKATRKKDPGHSAVATVEYYATA